MQSDLEQLLELLNYFSRPVYISQDDTVIFCNEAAQQIVRVGSVARAQEDDTVIPWGEYSVVIPDGRQTGLQQVNVLFFASQAMRLPLSSLFATASNLFPRLEALEDPGIQKNMSAFNRNFYQLLRLSCNLADLRAAATGEMRLFLQKTEVKSFLYHICLQMESRCHTCERNFEFNLPSQPFFADLDRQKVERALLNLLSNAIKFTEKGGTITLTASKSGGRLLLNMRDTGEGIDPELLPTVFTHYARPLKLDDPRCGFGAGLALVRHIARMHDGTLLLESEPGKGTSATLVLSLHPKADAEIRSPLDDMDYTGGFAHDLTELSDTLPDNAFTTYDVN